MKIKMYHIYGLVNKISPLVNKSMPAKTAYKIARLVKATETPLQLLQERTLAAMDKYCNYEEDGKTPTLEKNDSGQMVRTYTSENQAKLYKELSDLEQMEEEFPNITFSFEELDSIGDIEPSVLQALMPFIKEEE